MSKDDFTTTEAQRRAKAKWQDKNKDRQKKYTYRSQAKRFIKDPELSDKDDLKELQELIEKRLK